MPEHYENEMDYEWKAVQQQRKATAEEVKLPVLRRLAESYGDTALEYVSDTWGSEGGLMTAADVIRLHEELDWSDDKYRITWGSGPGERVLVDSAAGNAILVIPAAERSAEANNATA